MGDVVGTSKAHQNKDYGVMENMMAYSYLNVSFFLKKKKKVKFHSGSADH